MKAASYSARGPFAGRVVHHRMVHGPQMWRIKVMTEREGGQVDVQEVRTSDRVHISALASIVADVIRDCCAPGERLVDARMEFFIEPRSAASQPLT